MWDLESYRLTFSWSKGLIVKKSELCRQSYLDYHEVFLKNAFVNKVNMEVYYLKANMMQH